MNISKARRHIHRNPINRNVQKATDGHIRERLMVLLVSPKPMYFLDIFQLSCLHYVHEDGKAATDACRTKIWLDRYYCHPLYGITLYGMIVYYLPSFSFSPSIILYVFKIQFWTRFIFCLCFLDYEVY